MNSNLQVVANYIGSTAGSVLGGCSCNSGHLAIGTTAAQRGLMSESKSTKCSLRPPCAVADRVISNPLLEITN